jgi:hypothetical protein
MQTKCRKLKGEQQTAFRWRRIELNKAEGFIGIENYGEAEATHPCTSKQACIDNQGLHFATPETLLKSNSQYGGSPG